MKDFLGKLLNDDIVYHYTKAFAAIDHILYSNRLKFSKAKNSNDPI